MLPLLLQLTSLPKSNGNNSIITSQNANVPSPICSERIPQSNFTVIRQFNNTGQSHYFLNLALQSDPAAMQALRDIGLFISSYRPYITPANAFVSLHTLIHVASYNLASFACMKVQSLWYCTRQLHTQLYSQLCICTRLHKRSTLPSHQYLTVSFIHIHTYIYVRIYIYIYILIVVPQILLQLHNFC